MKIVIDEKVCAKYKLTLPEVLALTLVRTGVDIPQLMAELESKGAIIKEGMFSNYLVTLGYSERVDSIILDSDDAKQSDERLENLATALMELFPAMKKAGSSQYFRGNKKDTILRLKKFFKLYGNKFTNEQIISAAKEYVESFNGNYTYMRVLKYFIWKDERKTNSDGVAYIDEISDLASFIENEHVNHCNSVDWTSSIN